MGKPSKYNAVRSEADGVWFSSKKERDHYLKLKLLERSGHISNLILQPAFILCVNDKKIAKYVADFEYVEAETGKRVIEDVKGVKTPVYRLKKKFVEAQYGIEVREI